MGVIAGSRPFRVIVAVALAMALGAGQAVAQAPKPKPKPKPPVVQPKPPAVQPKPAPPPAAAPKPSTAPAPVAKRAVAPPRRPPEAPFRTVTVFAGGSTGGSGYGVGVLGGLAVFAPIPAIGKRVGVLVDGSFSRFARNATVAGPADVKLNFISGMASLVYRIPTQSTTQPYVFAGAGAHYASATTTAQVTPASESTVNLGGNAGVGVRLQGRFSVEARAIVVKGFHPINLRIGYSF